MKAKKEETILDESGNFMFSSEQIHKRRHQKRQICEDKIRKEMEFECSFSPEIDAKSVGIIKEKRGKRHFLEMVQEDIESRQQNLSLLQEENAKEIDKNLTFQPKINAFTFSKKKRKLVAKAVDLTHFVSPHRIREIAQRLHGKHREMEIKKQIKQKSVEREEERRRIESKVLASSRRLIVAAFLSKFKNVSNKKQSFKYEEIESVLKEIGFCHQHSLKRLLIVLDPNCRETIKWRQIKRFFKEIASNPSNCQKNEDFYQIIQRLYTQKLLRPKRAKSAQNEHKMKVQVHTKQFAKKWDEEIEKQKEKKLKNERLRQVQMEKKMKREMMECTFSPKTNCKTKGNTKRYEQLYEDAQDRKMRQIQKAMEEKAKQSEEFTASYTFKPKINEEIKKQNEVKPNGFDEAICRLAEGRIRAKHREIEQKYEQKKLELAWLKRSEWLKKQKEEKEV